MGLSNDSSSRFLCGLQEGRCHCVRHLGNPSVPKVLAILVVQAAFLQTFGNHVGMGKLSFPPHSDSGCWQSFLVQGLSMDKEVPGCQAWGLVAGERAG